MEKPVKRITRKALHIKMAELLSLRGTCGRLQVGAVATIENRIVSSGYNGPPLKEPHCSSTTCDLTKPCTRAIHAEENLIIWAKKEKISLEGSVLYCTHQPCIKCATLIVEAKIKKVYYLNPYRLKDGLNYLLNNGIKTQRLTNRGTKVL